MVLKKNYLGEMLIEQIIEFKLRGLGPFDRTCSPTTVFFLCQNKNKENL